MGLAGSRSVMGEINAHIWLCLPDRAQAQHLLGCVCARLWERLEPKALTTHYTADKPVCVRKVSQAVASSSSRWLPQICFLVKHSGASCRHANMCVKQHRACICLISVSFIFDMPFPIIPAYIFPATDAGVYAKYRFVTTLTQHSVSVHQPDVLNSVQPQIHHCFKNTKFCFSHTLVLLHCTSD